MGVWAAPVQNNGEAVLWKFPHASQFLWNPPLILVRSVVDALISNRTYMGHAVWQLKTLLGSGAGIEKC